MKLVSSKHEASRRPRKRNRAKPKGGAETLPDHPLFWRNDAGAEQIQERWTCSSESRNVVREELFRWLGEIGVSVNDEKALARLQIGIWLGVAKVPTGLVCLCCLLRDPEKFHVYKAGSSRLVLHFKKYHARVRSLGDLALLESYNPRGGRPRVSSSNCAKQRRIERNDRKKQRREALSEKAKQILYHTIALQSLLTDPAWKDALECL